jgi:hypothetical protein
MGGMNFPGHAPGGTRLHGFAAMKGRRNRNTDYACGSSRNRLEDCGQPFSMTSEDVSTPA